jgi:ABC-type nitrate/sulfonate/bicarbonate transport system substrate-binding protein
MAFVHARAQGWPVDRLPLVTVGNLDGAVAAFAAGNADVFFWEKLMTKPLVDAGQFRRVGEFTAPWPAFVVCAARACRDEQRAALGRVLAIVLDEARALRARPDAAALIARRYGLDASDVAEWLTTVRWSERVGVTADHVAPVCMALGSLGVLPRVVDAAECVVQLTPI